MKNNRHCKCKPRCYYLHREKIEEKILKWKRSIDYKAFKSTYTYLRINEEFRWQTEWRQIWETNRAIWGIESKPLYKQ